MSTIIFDYNGYIIKVFDNGYDYGFTGTVWKDSTGLYSTGALSNPGTAIAKCIGHIDTNSIKITVKEAVSLGDAVFIEKPRASAQAGGVSVTLKAATFSIESASQLLSLNRAAAKILIELLTALIKSTE